jgi:hypothetical protein
MKSYPPTITIYKSQRFTCECKEYNRGGDDYSGVIFRYTLNKTGELVDSQWLPLDSTRSNKAHAMSYLNYMDKHSYKGPRGNTY